jgi:N-acetylglucosaminyl-diphospho-decaprenol L-rhamnosyltransferase
MDISVIIVEYKDIDIVLNAVRSIAGNLSDLVYEIFVVSNSLYGPDTQRYLTTEFPGVNLIFNRENVGFAKACNQGIKESKGEHVLLVNPDASLLDRSIEHALDLMKKNNRIAIVGPTIIDRSGVVQDSCRNFMTFGKLLKRTLKRTPTSRSNGIVETEDVHDVRSVDWVSGACMLIRREAINEVGLLDERYFMYVEDMDWCRTFWSTGWEVWYQPGWKIEHNAGRGSTSGINVLNKLMWIHILSYSKYRLKWWRLPIKQDMNCSLAKK